MKLSEARKLREIIQTAVVNLEDRDASMAAVLFRKLKEDGGLIPAGTRINWRGMVKKAAVDLWDTAENNPDNAPDLWADLDYRDGIRIIPGVITVTTVFARGEQGWWNGVVYESLLDSNVHTPADYPAGWKEYTGA